MNEWTVKEYVLCSESSRDFESHMRLIYGRAVCGHVLCFFCLLGWKTTIYYILFLYEDIYQGLFDEYNVCMYVCSTIFVLDEFSPN